MQRQKLTRLSLVALVTLVVTLTLAVPGVWHASKHAVNSSGNAADDYLNAYMIYQRASTQHDTGSHIQASWNYLKAKHAFAAIGASSPDFKPNVLAFRRKKVDEDLVRSLKATIGL